MDYKEVSTLLDKYWKCETTLEEEAQLREYFRNEDIHGPLKAYAPLFRYYNEISGLESRTKLILNNNPPAATDINTGKRLYRIGISWYTRAAAVILLVLSVIVIRERMSDMQQKAAELTKDTFKNPEMALQETKKVLRMVSDGLRKGETQARKISEFNKAQELYKNEKQ